MVIGARRSGHGSQRQTWLLVALVTVVRLAVTGAAASWVRALQLGHRAANELLAIVNEILDPSRIEAGRVDLACEPFALPALVGDVIARMQVLAGDKDLGVTADVAPGVPQQVVGDPLRLRQVLTRLIANGVKFTDTGSVSLTVDRHDEGLVHFAVAETGIGIDPRDQERIFGSFEQADVSSTRRFGGTGPGLAIVTRLVRVMGGTIWLDRFPGVGSTFPFTVDLPADDATSRRPQRGPRTRTPASRSSADAQPADRCNRRLTDCEPGPIHAKHRHGSQ